MSHFELTIAIDSASLLLPLQGEQPKLTLRGRLKDPARLHHNTIAEITDVPWEVTVESRTRTEASSSGHARLTESYNRRKVICATYSAPPASFDRITKLVADRANDMRVHLAVEDIVLMDGSHDWIWREPDNGSMIRAATIFVEFGDGSPV